MVDITLRSSGSPLTHTQLDNNFSNLNQFEEVGTYNYFFYTGAWSGTGSQNVFIANVNNSLTTGSYNTTLGCFAGDAITTAQFNTCIGYSAGSNNTTAGYSTYVGAYAGGSNANGYQTFIGVDTGYTNYDAYAVSIGYGASKNMEGAEHVSVGSLALQGSTSYSNANYNTGVGYRAGQLAYGSDYMVAVGSYAGWEGGTYGVYVGQGAGYNSNQTSSNTYIGWRSGYNGQDNNNVLVGYRSGYYMTGTGCVYIGCDAANTNNSSNYIDGDYNISIGMYAMPSSSSVSHQCTIGSHISTYNITEFRIPGTATTITPSLLAHGGDIAAYYSSDIRLKENIHVIPDALSKVNALRGVTYDWTAEALEMRKSSDLKWTQRKEDVGVIAQEVEKVLPEIVLDRADGYKGIKYERLTALLIEAVKELSARVEELENGIS